MEYLLLVFSALCNGLKSVFAKKGNAQLSETHNIYTYNFYMLLIAFFIMVFAGIPTWDGLSLSSALLAVLYGVFLVLAQVFLIKAMDIGSVSVSTLIYSCGFIIPTITGCFLYDESISVIQAIALCLIVLSFVITVERGGKTSAKWLVFIFTACLLNGFVGITQKMFRMSEYSYQQGGFMMLAFLAGTIVAFFLMPKKNFSIPPKSFLKVVSGSGITIGLLNFVNVYLSGVLPAVIVFPGVNGGGVIASAILARILIGEKISIRKKIGILIGTIAICMIAI